MYIVVVYRTLLRLGFEVEIFQILRDVEVNIFNCTVNNVKKIIERLNFFFLFKLAENRR